jgi:hypothetical protein
MDSPRAFSENQGIRAELPLPIDAQSFLFLFPHYRYRFLPVHFRFVAFCKRRAYTIRQ